jgi:hypothetical protein
MSRLLEDVDDQEKADPHDVDEVPVVRGDYRGGCLEVAELLCCEGAADDEQEGNQAADDVQAVEARGDVER